MAREFFKNLPDTTTPLNAQRMNGFLNGEEAMGSIVVDDITCKNIFDKNNAKYLANSYFGGSATIGQTNQVKTYYVECEANKTYTISKKAGQYFRFGSSPSIPTLNATITQGIANDTGTSITLTTGANDKYLLFNCHNSSADTLSEQAMLDSVQVEKGPVATDYVDHKEFGYSKKSSSFIQGSSNGYGSNETVSTNETLDILTTTITTNESNLLIQPFVRVGVSDNNCFMHIYLDNVRIGTWAINTSNAYMSPVISKKVSAGEHTIKVQIEGSNAATTTVYGFPTKTLNVCEI